MVMDDKTPAWRHQITLFDREEMTIDGVLSLGSYDEKEIVMETEQGMLIVKGEGLNIKQLNLDVVTADEPVQVNATYFIISKKEQKFKEAFDKAVNKLKAQGTLSKLSKKWFGEDMFKYKITEE